MPCGDLAEHVSEVRRQRQITSFVKLIALESRPLPVNFSTLHAITQHKHRIRMSVVRAAIAVLTHRPAKFRHRQHNHIIHALAQILVERRDAAAELLQQVRQLPARIALVHMRVPASDVGKRHFQPDAGFNDLRDLK